MAEKKPPRNTDMQNALMGDLESVRRLLEPDGATSEEAADESDDEENIPVLDEVVPAGTPKPAPSKTPQPSQRWRMSSDAFVAQARALIQARGLGAHLGEAQTALIDALVDTLKAALDEEVDRVRAELHMRLQAELDHMKAELFKDGD